MFLTVLNLLSILVLVNYNNPGVNNLHFEYVIIFCI